MAYAQVEPFGPMRDDNRAGVVAATIANLFGRRKGESAVQPIEFFPDLKGPTKADQQEERNTRIAGTIAVLASMAPKKE